MCPPDFYGIEYEINPWMDRTQQADRELAKVQWQGLHDILVELGAKISTLTPIEGCPDLVFTANAAMIYQHRAVLSRFGLTRARKPSDSWSRECEPRSKSLRLAIPSISCSPISG